MYRASPLDELTQRLLSAERVLRERRRFEQQLSHIVEERVALAGTVADLEDEQQRELEDVENLKDGGFRAWVLELLGRLEDRLSKEQEEYIVASMAWENAKAQLDALDQDAKRLRTYIRARSNAVTVRQDVVRQFEEFLRSHAELRSRVDPTVLALFAGTQTAEATFDRASRFGKRLSKDIGEALDAGLRARSALVQLEAALHMRDDQIPLETLPELVSIVNAAHSALIRFSREVLDVYVLYPDAAGFGDAVLVSLHFVHDQPFSVLVGDARQVALDWMIKLDQHLDDLRKLR